MSDPTTISDAEVTVTSGPKVIQTTIDPQGHHPQHRQEWRERSPSINMSVRAAKGLRDMLNTSIAFEEQMPRLGYASPRRPFLRPERSVWQSRPERDPGVKQMVKSGFGHLNGGGGDFFAQMAAPSPPTLAQQFMAQVGDPRALPPQARMEVIGQVYELLAALNPKPLEAAIVVRDTLNPQQGASSPVKEQTSPSSQSLSSAPGRRTPRLCRTAIGTSSPRSSISSLAQPTRPTSARPSTAPTSRWPLCGCAPSRLSRASPSPSEPSRASRKERRSRTPSAIASPS